VKAAVPDRAGRAVLAQAFAAAAAAGTADVRPRRAGAVRLRPTAVAAGVVVGAAAAAARRRGHLVAAAVVTVAAVAARGVGPADALAPAWRGSGWHNR
jgi:hypothetical protein